VAVTKEEHLRKIADNAEFLRSIDASSPVGIGWAITVLFYSSLHYIEAYFVSRKRGFNNHHSRASGIQNDPVIRSLYTDYRTLENLSREARYDASPFNAGDWKLTTESFENIEKAIKALL
jgi:hypothetical protein